MKDFKFGDALYDTTDYSKRDFENMNIKELNYILVKLFNLKKEIESLNKGLNNNSLLTASQNLSVALDFCEKCIKRLTEYEEKSKRSLKDYHQ